MDRVPGPYAAQVLDHYKHPHNRGTLPAATHEARESNPLCGDEIAISLRVDADGRIEDVRFDGEGCAVSLASASMLTDSIRGRTLPEAAGVDPESMVGALGTRLSAVRVQCALLPLRTLRAALGRPSPAQEH